MPLWSRQVAESEVKGAAVSLASVAEAAEDVVASWLEKLGDVAGSDTLLRFAPTSSNSIDLTHAHPSGLAQLLAGRRTRLSTLLRDPNQYAAAMRTARSLRAKILELGADRGIDVGYLAAGTASWRVPEIGRSESLNAPVMLTPVALTVRPSQDDFELQLADRARLNPALVRHLSAEQGIGIDAEATARLAYGTARLDPHPVLERLRLLTADVRNMTIEHHLLVSTFADLEAVTDPVLIDAGHPVIRALAEAGAGSEEPRPATHGLGGVPVPEVELPPIDERDPQDEFLLLDADAAQQQVLDLVQAGHSLVVSTPPGTGQTQTALNAAAALAYEGKSVLVVAERRGTLNEFAQLLETVDLGSLALQLSADLTPDQLRQTLIRAISRSEKAQEPQLGKLHATLADHRHKLLDHVKSLHNVRSRWRCSPYQAMQSLAKLTSLDPAPATTVRLKRSVLDSITDRAELTARLVRAAELGSFSKSSTTSPWFGAKLLNRKETEDAHQLASDLSKYVPQLRTRMSKVAEHSQIALAETFREWGEQLQLLVEVRGSLDKFTPDIFDRPVTDLISATAPNSWRRDRGIEMSSMTRSRLRKVAKEYIRPGVHISDLHESLFEAQQQRTKWADYATSQRHPAVPSGLADLNSFYRDVAQRLQKLAALLAPVPEDRALVAMPDGELQEQLNSLAADKETLINLPERTLLLEQMREHGLGELLDDLAERQVGAEQVGAELDLAWWQSALEAMISGDDYLAMSDGDNLRKLEAVYRLADNAHIASGPARLRWELAQNWRHSLKSKPKAAHRLRDLLKAGEPTLAALGQQSESLVSALLPIWTASPLVLPLLLPEGKHFDAVIVLDAEATSLPSALAAVSRAHQVVAFGDGELGRAAPFEVNVDRRNDPVTGETPKPLTSCFHALSEVLPVVRLTTAYRAVDLDLTRSLSDKFYGGSLSRLPGASSIRGGGLEVEYLPDGTGMPGAGHEGVESVPAELNRVVDLVFEHISLRPSRSLAVVTASARHAARVAEAIRLQMPNYPSATSFFQRRQEPFRVVPVERASGLVRDDVIFSLGFGRTPHGRAVHDFGPLSAAGGRALFATAVTRSRHSLHVLSCFRPEDLDPERLRHGAVDFHELLDRHLGDGRFRASELSPGIDDPLVADLVERIRARGARVWDHYYGLIDIVASTNTVEYSPDAEPTLPVALESDGTPEYRQLTVRERSRLRPQQLERLGWRPLTLWTIEVFTDPEKCADLIGGYLGLQKPEEPAEKNGRAAAPGKPEPSAEQTGQAPAEPETDATAEAQDAGQDGLRPRRAKRSQSPTLPTKATEDDPRAWGDRDEDRDAWLHEQRPPHWG
ncbi:DUF4011 domain-containing protein [Arthrobacter sulfonylureivorans]|uniref:DUF4011 domain-containing protein n=1 Tax=Arthrobacter sulfonylureivorans TaxID=2486855 RepID=A0ABY3WIR5_9MICC|nr:DUF4011 domain-containing protein [Arthrobacter sulfonylureivorans]UNK47554.1 DUF4011 domain-containing protein [Arthrobacter sulfonylureivorans]